jgi:hypothetical protein
MGDLGTLTAGPQRHAGGTGGVYAGDAGYAGVHYSVSERLTEGISAALTLAAVHGRARQGSYSSRRESWVWQWPLTLRCLEAAVKRPVQAATARRLDGTAI